jgi:hypothetical protein
VYFAQIRGYFLRRNWHDQPGKSEIFAKIAPLWNRLILSLNDHWENSAIPLISDPEVHITFGVIPESCTTPLVTSEVKSRTVCINTTITCGTMPFVSQDLDV